MDLKHLIKQAATRIGVVIANRRIEAGYRKQARLLASHKAEIARLQKEQQREMQQLAGIISRREEAKTQLNYRSQVLEDVGRLI